MRTVEKYVFGSFLTAFALAWMVLSFVLTIGLLVKIAELVVQGVSARTVGLFLLIGFPETLTLTIPLALLVSALLVFSRLSADSEIAAMRACGINLLSVMRWPLLFALGCACLGFYTNNEIAPRAHEVRNNLRAYLSVDAGIELLEPGHIISAFDDVRLFFAKRDGNWIYGLRGTDFSQGDERDLTADKALITTNGADIVLEMYNATVETRLEGGERVKATAGRFVYVIPEALRAGRYNRKEKDFRFSEMLRAIRDLRANARGLPEAYRRSQLSVCRTLFLKRFADACAALCFVLVGIPLGIKAQRKDSTVGMGISLAVALAYYLIILGAGAVSKNPAYCSHVLVWLPAALCLALAAALIPRNL